MIAILFAAYYDNTPYILGLYSDEQKAKEAAQKAFQELYGNEEKASRKTEQLFGYKMCDCCNIRFSLEDTELGETKDTLNDIIAEDF